MVNVCAIVLIAVSLFVLLTVVLTPSGQVPSVLGFSILHVTTGSMEPAIPVNAMIIVRKTDPVEIETGDIITFFSTDPNLDGAPVTHRVESVNQLGGEVCFTTRGDANLLADADPVSPDRLIGKVVFISSVMGIIIRLLSNPLVFCLVIMLPLLGILVMNIYRTVRTAAKLARQEEEEAIRQAIEAVKAKQEQNKEKLDDKE